MKEDVPTGNWGMDAVSSEGARYWWSNRGLEEAFLAGERIVLIVSTRGASDIHPFVTPYSTGHADPLALPVELSETVNEIHSLRDLPPGWNGYDVPAPKFNATESAVSWIKGMYWDALETGRGWRKPHVAADENGDVVLEWWNGEQGLTVYISEEEAIYIKDWGLDVVNEMEDGTASTFAKRRELWSWLTG